MKRFLKFALPLLLLLPCNPANASIVSSSVVLPTGLTTNDGSITTTVADSPGCTGATYTVNASPVASSGPGGSTPPFTSVVTYIGFPAGPFLFANAGFGQYTITVSTTSVCTEAPNVSTVTLTPPAPTSIPTLSEWGMIILSSLLALGTVIALRRQRS